MIDTQTSTTSSSCETAPPTHQQGDGDAVIGVIGEDATPVDELVRQIHAGQVPVARLPVEVRRRCVRQLTCDGYSTVEIAHLLHMGESSVRRDRATIRKDEALAPGRKLGDELLGEFQRIALASVQRLTRLANTPDAPPFARLWAEESMNRIYQRFIETVKRLDYLETGTGRLGHEAYCDPAEIQRAIEHNQVMWKRLSTR